MRFIRKISINRAGRRRAARVAAGILVLLSLLLAGLDIFCETRGLPHGVLDALRRRLAQHGIRARIARVQLGLVHGLRLRDVCIEDGQLPRCSLLQVADLRIKPDWASLASRRTPAATVILRGARIVIPDPQRTPRRPPLFVIRNVRCRADYAAGVLHIHGGSGEWGRVRLSASGLLSLFASARRPPRTPQPRRPKARPSPPPAAAPAAAPPAFSILPLLRRLPPDQLELLRTLAAFVREDRFTNRAAVAVRFRIPLRNVRRGLLRVSLIFPRFKVRGIACGPAEAALRIEHDSVRLLSFSAACGPQNGHISARGELRGTGKIRLGLEFRLPPETVLGLAGADATPRSIALPRSTPVSGRLQLHAAHWNQPESWLATLELGAATIHWAGLTATDLALTAKMAENRIVLERAAALIGQAGSRGKGDPLQVTGALDLASRDWTLDFQTALHPVLRVREFAPKDKTAGLRRLLNFLDEPSVLELTGQARGSLRPRPAIRELRGRLRGRGVAVAGLALQRCSADFAITPKTLRIPRFTIEGPDPATLDIHGTAEYTLHSHRLAAELRGQCTPALLAGAAARLQSESAPPGNPAALLRDFQTRRNAPLQFHWTLHESPLGKPAEWSYTAHLQAANFRFRNLPVARLQLDAQAAQGRIAAHFDLAQPARTPQHPASHVHGTFEIDPSRRTLSGRFEGRLDLPQAWTALRLPPNKTIRKLRFSGGPAAFSAKLGPCPISPKKWTADVQFQADDGWFDTVHVFHIEAALALRPNHLTLTISRAKAAGAPNIRLTLDMDLHPKRYSLHCRVTGDPRIAAAFVGKKGRRHYLAVWKDFHWPDRRWPTSTIRSLVTWRDPKTRRHHTQLTAVMDSGPVQIRNLRLERLHSDIRVDLPHTVVLPEFQAAWNGNPLTGSAVFLIKPEKICRFHIRGRVHPDTVIPAILPKAAHLFRDVEFAPNTDLEISGAIPLRHDPAALALDGSVRAPRFQWGKWRLQDLRAHWKYAKGQVAVRDLAATSWNGTVTGRGTYEIHPEIGAATLEFHKISVDRALAGLSGHKVSETLGEIESRITLTRIHPLPHHDLELRGKGNFQITGADLWDIPILKELADLVSHTALKEIRYINPLEWIPGYAAVDPIRRVFAFGRITEVDGSLEFAGDHLHIPEIATDGDLVALAGAGDYRWKDQRIDFTVRIVPLKKTWIIPFAWRTLSQISVQGARCTGSLQKHHWQIIGPWFRLWSAEPPHLGEENPARPAPKKTPSSSPAHKPPGAPSGRSNPRPPKP